MNADVRATEASPPQQRPVERLALLLRAVKELSFQRNLDGVMNIVRVAARELTGADGVTFVLLEGDQVHYAEENAIAPLWKGRRFPARACISGWVVMNRQPAVIEDIYADPRIPVDAYRPTFVRSLAMVPVRAEDPIGAIGAYWRTRHLASPGELESMQTIADAASLAIANAQLIGNLEQAVKVRDEFIGIASHELRTPLTPLKLQVQSMVRSLERGGETGAPTLERLRKVEGHVSRLEQLVDELLDVSRIMHGTLRIEPRRFDMADALGEVVQRFQQELEASGSHLQFSQQGDTQGLWDQMRVEQALSNVLANAIKYGRSEPIEVSVDGQEDRVVVSIRDHGIGIAEQDLARIFERFERAAPARHFGGFGVGLWIAREIVRGHGGSIEVQSSPGAGSIFLLSFPRA